MEVGSSAVDTLTAATPLGLLAEKGAHAVSVLENSSEVFIGQINGSLGETSGLLLLIGGVFLIFRKIISWHIPVSFIGTVAAFAAISHAANPDIYAGAAFHVFTGGVMIGAFFMATDYVTSPMFSRGKIIFGIGCGILTMVIRLWAGYPEGVSFAVLLMNAAVPIIDRYTRPKKFGLAKLAAAAKGGKLMPETAKMLIVLTLIAGLAGFGLSAMNSSVQEPIKANERNFTLRSIKKVLPDAEKPDACEKYEALFDNEPMEDAICLDGFKIYRARKGQEIAAIAVESVGDQAYDGTILTLIGLRVSDGMLLGVEVLKHKETPGLGALMTNCDFQQQMVGNGPDDIKWTVKKDGGDIDQLTGATISSRCMLNAIGKAQRLLAEKKDEILNAEPLKSSEEVCDGK